MTTATEAAARKYLEAKSSDDLRGIIDFADARLPMSAAHRADLDWSAAAARDILAARA